jgi:ATP-dependent helicase/nuclease subunit B
MPVTLNFQGWTRSLLQSTADWLLPPSPDSRPVSLQGTLVIVASRAAARRLREKLTQICDNRGQGLLDAQILTPTPLLTPQPLRSANPSVVLAAWTTLLTPAQFRRFPDLFPRAPAPPNPAWTAAIARQFESLRHQLAEGRLTISEVLTRFSDRLAGEIDRWRDLAALEQEYLELLRRQGFEDPLLVQSEWIASAPPPADLRRIVLAGLLDPPTALIALLDRWGRQCAIEILIPAPPETQALFDDWGRPILPADSATPDPGAFWSTRILPLSEKAIHIAGTPADQVQTVIRLIASLPIRPAPQDIAIGVPDPSLIPRLENGLKEMGISAADPSDRPLLRHRIGAAVQALGEVAQNRQVLPFALLLRHPDVLTWLAEDTHHPPEALLKTWDEFQNRHLPATLDDVRILAERHNPAWNEARNAYAESPSPAPPSPGLTPLRPALVLLLNLLPALESDPLSALRGFLQNLYRNKTIVYGNPEDDEFAAAAEALDALLRETEIAGRSIAPPLSRAILLDRLSTATLPHRPDSPDLELEGWLELPWNDAPALVITGLNEGLIPESRFADLFLPDSLRQTLGLRCDATRFARDAFWLTYLIESRHSQGRIELIAGRTGPDGDPLLPSRLLFQCAPDQLVDRVKILFARPPAAGGRPIPSRGFRLDPSAARLPAMPDSISVTAFSAYLRCPFRFYLESILRMERRDDRKTELDALDFGQLIHESFKRFGRHPDLRDAIDSDRIAEFLELTARDIARSLYGDHPVLAVELAVDSAVARLQAAAQRQAEWRRQGWQIVAVEKDFSMSLSGLTIKGRIDRIDRHEDGRWCVIDYKTTDTSTSPAEAHLKKRRGTPESVPDYALADADPTAPGFTVWTNLQLPLYVHLLRADSNRPDGLGIPPEAPILPAFFLLPLAQSETALWPWPECDPQLLASALASAEKIAANIKHRVFAPAADLSRRNDVLDLLTFDSPENAFDWEAFARFCREGLPP